MFSKRGQGIEFNWLFVLIAGFLFLIFLFGFGVRYANLSEDQDSLKIELKLDNVIESVRSQNQYRSFSAANQVFNLKYTCSEKESSTLSIDEQFGINVQDIVFVENQDFKEMIVWSQEFKQPYKISNIIYLINKDKKYYFDPSYEFDLPETINVVNIREQADVIVSDNNGDVWFDGSIVHYKDGSFISLEDLDSDEIKLGAVFSSKDIFNCNVERLKDRREFLDVIYEQKMNSLTGCNYETIDFEDRANLEKRNLFLVNKGCEAVF